MGTGNGAGAVVALTTPAGRVLARVTRRSVAALGLSPGLACHAIVKTVSIAPGDVGSGVASDMGNDKHIATPD